MIAISYRREDSLPVAGRLYDRLQSRFGKDCVFMDFDSIRPGLDFRQQIEQTIERAKVIVAIVGPKWLGERGSSARRIDEPGDFVRLEIGYALKRNVPVIPLLVDDTPMPSPETLPAELREFAFRHALPLDSGVDFHHHADRLISGICDLLPNDVQSKPVDTQQESRKKGTFGRWLAAAAGIILVTAGGLVTWKVLAPTGPAKTNESILPAMSAPPETATTSTSAAQPVAPSPDSTPHPASSLPNRADLYSGTITIRGQSETGGGRQLTITVDPGLTSGQMTQSTRRGDFVVNFEGNWQNGSLHAVTTDVVMQPAGIEWTPESFVLRFADDGKSASYECTANGKTYVAQLNGQKRASDAHAVYNGAIKKAGAVDLGVGLIIRFSPDRRSGTETQTSRSGDTVVRFSGVWDGTTFRAITDDVITKPDKVQWTPESFVIRFDDTWREASYECRAGGDLYTAQLAARLGR